MIEEAMRLLLVSGQEEPRMIMRMHFSDRKWL